VAAITEWVTANANALSGYVILIIGVVIFIVALGTGNLYLGRNVNKAAEAKNAQLAKCEAALLQCEHPPQEVP